MNAKMTALGVVNFKFCISKLNDFFKDLDKSYPRLKTQELEMKKMCAKKALDHLDYLRKDLNKVWEGVALLSCNGRPETQFDILGEECK